MVVDQILAAVISGLPDPAAVVREDHKIVRCNRPFLALASLNYVQMQRRIREGISLGDIVRANDGEDVECLRRCLSEDKVFRLAEVSARTARGQELVLWQAFIPIKENIIEIGMTDATIKAARKLPSITSNTTPKNTGIL